MLGRVAFRRGWRVYAWALMTNHFHLFLKVPAADLSEGMHELNSGYVSVYNRRHQRCGPLYQGRFKGILVEQDHHFWALTRYIHWNPVREGLATVPEAYRWSSCSFYFRTHLAPSWLAWQEVLQEHGNSLRSSQRAYRHFLLEDSAAEDKSPLLNTSASTLFGSPAFLENMKLKIQDELPVREVPAAREFRISPEIKDILKVVGDTFGIDKEQLVRKGSRKHGRAIAMYLANKLGAYPIQELGDRFGGISGQAVSNIVVRVKKNRAFDPRLDRDLRRMEAILIEKCRMKT